MSPRARVAAALAHRIPDRIPVDFGSTAVTGIHCSVVAGLRAHYGLDPRPVRVIEPYQMLGEVDADLAAAMAIDTIGVPAPRTLFGFPNRDWETFRCPWGQEVLVAGGFAVDTQADGALLLYPEGDRNAPPSAHLPAGGYFFDTIIRQMPLDDDHLDPADNLEEFSAISAADLAYFKTAVDAAWATGRAVVATIGGTALGDIALVPAPFMKHPKGIRDIAAWYMATADRPEYVHAVFTRQVEIALANLAQVHATVGDRLTAVFLCGTDFGTQRGPFCSRRSFQQVWLPHYQRLTGWIHQHTTWKVFKHSCGGIRPFLDDFVAAGFDILNPVQCSAAGMDAVELKQAYGDRLCFWGGGVDTQQVLPFGSPAQVREQVIARCRTFATGGGFVFDAIHNVQALTPIANVVAMIDAVDEVNHAGG